MLFSYFCLIVEYVGGKYDKGSSYSKEGEDIKMVNDGSRS